MTPLDVMKQALEALEETTALCINSWYEPIAVRKWWNEYISRSGERG